MSASSREFSSDEARSSSSSDEAPAYSEVDLGTDNILVSDAPDPYDGNATVVATAPGGLSGEAQWTTVAIVTLVGVLCFAAYGGVEILAAFVVAGVAGCLCMCCLVAVFVWGPAGYGGYSVHLGTQQGPTVGVAVWLVSVGLCLIINIILYIAGGVSSDVCDDGGACASFVFAVLFVAAAFISCLVCGVFFLRKYPLQGSNAAPAPVTTYHL